MSIRTVFAHVSCSDIGISLPWYEKLLGRAPIRRPSPELADFQFTDSAEVQLYQQPEHAGHTPLTLGVLPIQPEYDRLAAAGLNPSEIEQVEDYFVLKLCDPDNNKITLASARRT